MAGKRSTQTSCLKEGDILIARNKEKDVIFLEIQSFTKAGRPRVMELEKVIVKSGHVRPGNKHSSYERIPAYSAKTKTYRYHTQTDDEDVIYYFDVSLNSLYQGNPIHE